MIGQTLNNRYTILARLGRGAMGTVYRATDTQSGRDVALKIISSELAVDPAMLERFKREGEALRQLKHVNIVGYIDAFQHDEQAVIVMEHVEGGSLYDLIKKGPLPIEYAIQMALDLCDALIRSHRLKIIHRDIKPENILIDNDGTPKLADFGVARLSEGTRMTRSGVQVGTPYYMSPEAWEGRTLDAQTDIWSLGVVLFEMLSGQVPFGGDTPLAVMTKISTTPPPDLRKLRADVPAGLVRIIGRMLTRNKQRRYQTMREVAVDLERGQQSTTPVPIPRPRPIDPAEVERRRERRAARRAALTKNVNTILSGLKSALTKFVSGSSSAVRKVPPYFLIAGIIGLVVLVIAVVYFPSLQSPVDPPVSPPADAPTDGSVVFSIPDSGVFYLHGESNPFIAVGGGDNWDPVLSPGGNIYFTSNRDGKAEIYRRFPAGRIERFTNTPDPFESWGAAPSIGGNLYFTSNREDGKAEIYRRLIDGNIERVTNTGGEFESWGSAPSPGGNLYFTSDREDNKAEIYRRLINGGIERVTNTDGEFGSWGPIFYGLNIYFTSNRSVRNEVYLLDPLTNILNIESWTNLSDESSDEASPLFPNHLE